MFIFLVWSLDLAENVSLTSKSFALLMGSYSGFIHELRIFTFRRV